jgi:uncharacterized protein (TIGR03435 family)
VATSVAQSVSGHSTGRSFRASQTSPAHEIHITPTTMAAGRTSMTIGSDSWTAIGYDLRSLIAQVYDVDARRIEFPGAAADARYDVSLTLSDDVDQNVIHRLLQEALKKKFRLAVTPENKTMDVYVLTAPNGPGTALHRHMASVLPGRRAGLATQNSADGPETEMDDMQQITFIGKECSGVSSGAGITMSAETIAEFRRTLEPDMDRLLIDETGLAGNFDFAIGGYANRNELFKLMREQLGIVVTAAERKVDVLAVRSAQELDAKNFQAAGSSL